MKRLSLFLGIALSISALVGVIFGLDQRFAKSTEVEQVAMRLDQKILEDQEFGLQKRIWLLEDRCKKEPSSCTPEVLEEIRMLKQDLQRVREKLKRLYNKG